ncbi:MAG: GrpB family protein [Pseudomonadota bacterium]
MIVPPDPHWPAAFRGEAERIAAAVPNLRLHHIGSTAVPGLAAKPIIDILGEAEDLASVSSARLAALDYASLGAYGVPGRRYFRRDTNGRRSHHLHVFETGSEAGMRHLALRDYLRANGRARAAYAAEKARAAAAATSGRAYQDEKAAFLDTLVTRAVEWANRPRVIRSINDGTGSRCVDIRVEGGAFSWVECRRDPEDSHGWRLTGAGEPGFATPDAAIHSAAQSCPWVMS